MHKMETRSSGSGGLSSRSGQPLARVHRVAAKRWDEVEYRREERSDEEDLVLATARARACIPLLNIDVEKLLHKQRD